VLSRQAATVCMEWSPLVEGTSPSMTSPSIVKFFIYDGGTANAPSTTSVDLDGGGRKYVPQLCASCHGGIYTPGTADMKASFREFDLATFKFPGGRDVPNGTERAAFKQQNLIVRGNSTEDISAPAIKNLVNGWYGISQTYVDPHPTFTGQYSNRFPPGMAATGWDDPPGASSDTRTSHRYLYRTVVAQSCRTCHVAFLTLTGRRSTNSIMSRRLGALCLLRPSFSAQLSIRAPRLQIQQCRILLSPTKISGAVEIRVRRRF